MHIHIHLHMRVCIYIYTCKNTNLYAQRDIYKYVHTHTHTHISIYTSLCIHKTKSDESLLCPIRRPCLAILSLLAQDFLSASRQGYATSWWSRSSVLSYVHWVNPIGTTGLLALADVFILVPVYQCQASLNFVKIGWVSLKLAWVSFKWARFVRLFSFHQDSLYSWEKSPKKYTSTTHCVIPLTSNSHIYSPPPHHDCICLPLPHLWLL